MRNKKLQIFSIVLLGLLALFITPSEALAVVQSLNGQTGQDQTFQNDSNITISSSSNTHILGWQGQLPVSRGGTGAGSFLSGSILFSNGTTFAQDNSNFFWDDINNRLGIGTASPATILHVNGDATINSLTIGLGGGAVSTNTALGKNALSSSSSANNNTAVGFGALSDSNNSGEQNTAVGSQALSGNTTGNNNSAYGFQSLWLNTSGGRNVAVGHSALHSNSTGGVNVALGSDSMGQNTTGGQNVAIGETSFSRNTTGGGNVVIGHNAARVHADGTTFLTTANSSIYIGDSVQGYDNNDSNSIVVGTGAIGAGANKAVIGNSSLTDVYFGSASGFATIHGLQINLGTSSTAGCIVMGDSDGSGVTYITANNGVLSASSTKPAACQ